MGDSVNSSDENNSLESNKISFLPKEKKYIMVTDEETGKIKGCFPLKPKNLGKGWIALYQQAISNIADMNLTNEQYRVFLKLLSKVDFENYLTVSQKEISEELNIKQPHISRAIKDLCNMNIIVEGPRAGLNKTYRLNPYVAHKGSNRTATILDFGDALEKSGKRMTDANIDLN